VIRPEPRLQLAPVRFLMRSSADLPTNKLLSSAWLDRLDLAWFLQIKLPIVDSKPNQAVIEGLLNRLDRLDNNEHISAYRDGYLLIYMTLLVLP
jgi:hypothetical protein